MQVLAVYQYNKAASTGSYTLDDGSSTYFNIPRVETTSYGNLLFSQTGLSPTNHTLITTFTGTSSQAPLRIATFLVTLPPGNSPLVSTAELIEPATGNSVKHSNSTGAIAGGVVGGVVGDYDYCVVAADVI